MTNKKTTKRALLTSIMAMFLCLSMFVGTTFAWFTDTVKSGVNQIIAGNLDVELYNALTDDENYKVDDETKLFDEIKLWEPGVVAYENLTVVNKGNLALKYQLSVNFANATATEGGKTLVDVLKVALIEGGIQANATREEVLAAAEKAGWKSLVSFAKNGELLGEEKNDKSDTYTIVIYWQPRDIDNEYNMNKGSETEQLYIELGVKLVATQLTAENDSFDNTYDADAILPWDGSADDDWYDATKTEYVLYTAEEFAGLSQLVAEGTSSFSGKTVKLGADINLGNVAWTPIGACDSKTYFQGTFDGQGNTIYNLYVDNSTDTYMNSTSGLFGWVDAAAATIKNVNVDGATVKGSHWVGVIAGYFTGRIENCSVNNATVVAYNLNDEANGDKVGGIVGCLNSVSYLNDNTVSNSTITGNRDIGGIAGSVAASTFEMKNNKVSDTIITYSTARDDYASAGEIVSGRTGYSPDETNVATNVTIVKSVMASTADELAAALTSTDKNIAITLASDIDVPITSLGQQTSGSGEYKLGGEETETITIDLNQHKLTITTGYWSVLGAKNNDAVFTIKNGSMTSSQPSGTWNSYDLSFANCNYVIENVTFDKAIALENAGKSATLKNVTINENNGDYYAMWITAEGQNVTIDGLTVNSVGRGIKIDGEYVDPTMKVTLNVSNATFNTVKKAAILVDSPAGADIKLSNTDISGVKVDPVNAVWVDSDATAYAGNVTVDGGTKVKEADLVTDSEELAKAITDGKTDIQLAGGTYTMPSTSANVTISGSKNVVLTLPEGVSGNGNTITFDGITIVGDDEDGNWYTTQLNGAAKAIYKNCTIKGLITGYCNSDFINCVFENNFSDEYSVYCYSGSTYNFTDCTFNTACSKAIKVYDEGNSATNGRTVNVTNCKFVASASSKAAVEIDSTQNGKYVVNITNCEINEYYTELWNDKGTNSLVTVG